MTKLSDQIEAAAKAGDDECECGDYRKDHLNGTGPCRFNGGNFDLTHGGRDCTHFRLVHPLEKCGPGDPQAE